MPTNKLFLSLALLLILCSVDLAQELNWRPFSPSNQPWSILAPGPMMPDAEAQKSGNNKGSYSYNDFNGFFVVIYRNNPKRWLPWKANYSDHYNKVRDDVVKANRGEILKDIEFSKRRMVGREVYVKFPTGTTKGIEGQTIVKHRVQRFRMFFLDDRFYIVLAVLNENEIDSPAINRYFDSFAYNTAPEAIANSYSINEDSILTVNAANGVLANDKDLDGNTLTVSSSKPLTEPTNGSLTLNSDGSLTYKPSANFFGKDTFTYKANDGLIDSASATVTITVNPVNDPPILSGLPSSTTLDELISLGITATASDIDNTASSLRFSLTSAPQGATINAQSGAISWTPTEAQGPGNHTFQVNLSDGQATANATLNVTVREVNAAPQFANFPASSTINELELYSAAASASDSDIPAQSLAYSLIDAPAGVSMNSTNGLITWTPTESQGNNSTFRLTVRASDGVTSTDAVINLKVNEVNSAPALAAIADQTIDELKTFSATASGSDSDIPTNALTYSLESGAPTGMTINSQTGAIAWVPTETQGPGDYTIGVRLTDNGTPALSDVKSFKVRVNEVNTAPELAPIGNKTINEETLLTFNATATDADLPANALTYSLVNAPAGATLNPTIGVFTWTPNESQGSGTYTITFRVTDSGVTPLSDEETVTITVNEVNKAPVANQATITTNEDAAASFTLTASDVDVPSNILAYSIVKAPAHGKLSGTAPNLTYTPDTDFNGVDSFAFKVNDRLIDSNTATVNIDIKPVNDAPLPSPDNVTTEQDIPINVNVVTNDKDVDGDKLVLTNVSNAINGTVEIIGGEARFTPSPRFSGTGSFNYTISDGKGGTAIGSVTVTVNPRKST